MTTADWDEVKRLAADFQKAQLSNALQKLSERNCVEIITKLTESKLLDVIFTNDGKEYVTPQHLSKEIKDELYIHGGRVNLADLASILNVDLSQISKLASDIEKHDKGIKIILGQLVDKSYVAKIAEEINDKLNQNGFINVAELTLLYDLPAEFLKSTIERELGKTIFGKQDQQDSRIFYNQDYIARNEAKVRGALSALTKPTPISAILGQCTVPERIFFSILENLQGKQQIPGVVTGKQSSNSIYVPTIYSKGQSEWVDSFYKQNGYLEFDALQRLGISDPKSFVKRHFPNERVLYLDTVAVGMMLVDQVDANIEDVVATGSFTDIYPLLPTVFTPQDVEMLLKESLSRIKTSIHIFATTVIVSDAYLQTLQDNLESLAMEKSKKAVESGTWLQHVVETKIKSKNSEVVDNKSDRRAERRKKATGGKAGGGSQGRETKTKSTKKKYHPNKKHEEIDSDDDVIGSNISKNEFDLVNMDDIKAELERNENLADIEEFLVELANHFHPLLNKYATEVAQQLSLKHKTTNLSEIEDKLNSAVTSIRVYEKGIRCLEKVDQGPLSKYLLKTIALDFVTDIFKLAAQQNVLQCPPNLTTEARQKILQNLPKEVKGPLTNLHKAVLGDSVDDFLSCVDSAMAACCLVLKKYDKKKDRPVIVNHREGLLEQLNNTHDPALALHLTTAILFTAATQNALHMSGRHVSVILYFLNPFLKQETSDSLTKHHDLVLKFLSCSDDHEKVYLQNQLEECMIEIKTIANEYKQQIKTDKVQES